MRTPVRTLCLLSALLAPSPAASLCPIDPTSASQQAGAASGSLGYPTAVNESCGAPVQSEWQNVGPVGGSYWEGTGRGAYLSNETDWYRAAGTGHWGWGPATQGSFFLPDLVISGGPGPTVSVRVNVLHRVIGSGDLPISGAPDDLRWRVLLRDPAGNPIADVVSTRPWSANDPAELLESSPMNAPVGSPFTLEIVTQWSNRGPGCGGIPSCAWDASAWLALRPDEVFELPSGYTLDSALGGINGNQIGPKLPCSGANLLANGEFDTDTSSWSNVEGFANMSWSWDALDEDDDPGSGSIEILAGQDDGSFRGVASECVAVSPGLYEMCGRHYLPSGQVEPPLSRMRLLQYASGDCSGAATEQVGPVAKLQDSWLQTHLVADLDGSVGSVRVALDGAKDELDPDAIFSHFDAVHLPEPSGAAAWLSGAALLVALRRRRG